MTNRTLKNINLIWKHTHADFKGECSKEKSIMARGAIGPIATLPDEVFSDCLSFAKRKEIRLKRDKALIPIFCRFNIDPSYITSTEQGRDSLSDVIGIINYALKGNGTSKAIKAVEDANITFLA
jgi:hypothetical protein